MTKKMPVVFVEGWADELDLRQNECRDTRAGGTERDIAEKIEDDRMICKIM